MLSHAKEHESFTGKLLLSTALVAVTVGYGWWQHQQEMTSQQAAAMAAMQMQAAPVQSQAPAPNPKPPCPPRRKWPRRWPATPDAAPTGNRACTRQQRCCCRHAQIQPDGDGRAHRTADRRARAGPERRATAGRAAALRRRQP